MSHIKQILLVSLISIVVLSSCTKNDIPVLTEPTVSLSTHKLVTSTYIKNSKYLVVFESGLGDGQEIWKERNIMPRITPVCDVLLYDRAGYGKSDTNTTQRNINKLRSELEIVINQFSNGRKVILVGHSLGGMIIRDYAIKNPSKTAALLFVDASHEMYNNPTQLQEDIIYNIFKTAYGENFGGTAEAKELREDAQYMSGLPSLPNVPVIAITSMKIDADHNLADRQLWYNSTEALKRGVADFLHITTVNSGHYIMLDEPNLVINNIKLLLSKLP